MSISDNSHCCNVNQPSDSRAVTQQFGILQIYQICECPITTILSGKLTRLEGNHTLTYWGRGEVGSVNRHKGINIVKMNYMLWRKLCIHGVKNRSAWTQFMSLQILKTFVNKSPTLRHLLDLIVIDLWVVSTHMRPDCYMLGNDEPKHWRFYHRQSPRVSYDDN